MEESLYNNPVLEYYECDGQMDIFDFINDTSVKREEKESMKTYVVTCNAEPTCIITAENKKEAESMAKVQADKDLGDCDENWEANEINEYFKDIYEPSFFGWVKSADQIYI